MKRRRWLGLIALLLLVIGAAIPMGSVKQAEAARGDFTHRTYFERRCPSGIGVGIAFDGEFLWYSCYRSSPDLFKAQALDGTVVAAYNVAGGLGALAWDGKRKMIWAGWGGGAGHDGDIRLIDPSNGTARVVFNASAAAWINLDDGLAYDAAADQLLVSPDGSSEIYRYSADGRSQGIFHWAGGSTCFNSGLAMGGDLLFQGANGCNRAFVANKATPSVAVYSFSTVVAGDSNYRDEDLECDSVTFAPKTVMWSIEAYEPRRAVAFEIEPGSCATGGGVDSDGDGLLDEWEKDGVWIDPDGAGPIAAQFQDLPAMGADPAKPDIFVQIDWMENTDHSHHLQQGAIRKVSDAFANAPYVSPTGSVGINFHVDQGPDSIRNFATGETWGALSKARSLAHVDMLGSSGAGGYDWSDFDAIKNAAGGFTQSGRGPIFHYVISAHDYEPGGSSGLSRGISASDLIVSLGHTGWPGHVGTLDQQAGTLMHELGHNLNLRHGGDANTNYKPNYLSIMNYLFQLTGVRKGGGFVLDYSRKALASLNEANLSEPGGLGADAAGFGTIYYCTDTASGKIVADATAAINWNCDGDTTDTGVAGSVNKDLIRENLGGFDDWSHIKFKGGWLGLAGYAPPLPAATEPDTLDPVTFSDIPKFEDCTADPSLTWKAPLSKEGTYDLPHGEVLPIRFGYGSCSGFIADESVIIAVQDPAMPDYPVATWVYGYDIAIDAANQEYRQDFDPALYGIAPGTLLEVEVLIGDQLAGVAHLKVE